MFALVLAAAATLSPLPVRDDPLRVRVDSAKRVVVVTAGPFDIPPGGGHGDMPGMDMGGGMNAHASLSPLLRFEWPVTGWIRAVELRTFDKAGKPLSRKLIHHVNLINFGRRQLFYTTPEITIAMGQETENINLPASVGVPMATAMPMGLVVAWHNDGKTEIKAASVEMRIQYMPTNMTPRPLSVLPVMLDVVHPVGRESDFDLPNGETRWSADFTSPIGGRIIGAGGHQHDYGTGLTLQEVLADQSTRDVVRLDTKRSPTGKMLSIARTYPGLTGNGIRVMNGKSYRMVGTYDNPTGKTLIKGAMVNMVLLFAPDDLAKWPTVSTTDPDYVKEVAWLERNNVKAGMAEHNH